MTPSDTRPPHGWEATYRDVLEQMANGASEPMLRPGASSWALREIDRLRDGLQRVLATYENWEQYEKDDPVAALDAIATVCDEMLEPAAAGGDAKVDAPSTGDASSAAASAPQEPPPE